MKTAQQNIHNHLLLSKNTGLAIHIKLKDNHDYFISCVETIVNGTITIKPVSLHGIMLSTDSFRENEIEVAKCLNVNYNAPFYVQLRAIKESIRYMKDQIRETKSRL